MPAEKAKTEGRSEGKRRQGTDWLAVGLTLLFAPLFAIELLLWVRTMAGAMPNLTALGASDGVFFVIAILIAGIARWLGTRAWGEQHLATLVVTAPVVPLLGAVLIALLYVSAGSGAHANPIYLGVASAFGVWVFTAPPMRWIASADTAQPRSYGELLMRSRGVATKLDEIREVFPPETPAGKAQMEQALSFLAYLRSELGDPAAGLDPAAGFRYANAVGYLNLWRALHRAEELLIQLQPRHESFGTALLDSVRIGRMPKADVLLAKLRKALATFGDEAAPAICDDTLVPVAVPSAQATAITVLAQVRHAFNVYQDDSWERLVRQRNRLMRTALITSFVALLLVALAVAFTVSKDSLGAALSVALVGALIGLFARLGAEARSGPALDDYGLFEARLLATPLLSALAALGGVVVVTFAAGFLQAGTDAAPALSLDKAFSLSENPRALLTAAIFGLTPELLTSWLNKEANTITSELSESRSSQTG